MTIRRGQGHSVVTAGADAAGDPRTRRALVWALDALNALILVAIFSVGREPDALFHAMWVVLVIQAFMFGLRTALIRLAAIAAAIVIYAILSSSHVEVMATLSELELSEWPLMFVIALLVAVMAERQGSEGRRYAALYRGTSERLISAQEDERRRFARDLHDGVGQTLTALTLTLDAAEALVWDGHADPSDRGHAAVKRAQQLAATAVEEAHDIAYRLQPSRIADVGLVSAVQELAASAGIPVSVTADDELQRIGVLAPAVELEVFRIVQEALGNAARHSQASGVTITIGTVGGRLQVAVTDDGVGFVVGAAESQGLGMASMAERAAAIDGSLDIQSHRDEGTTVLLRVPLVTIPPYEASPARPSTESNLATHGSPGAAS